MTTVIELKDGTVLKVHESVDEVRARLETTPDAEFLKFNGVSGAAAVARPSAVVDVRDERL